MPSEKSTPRPWDVNPGTRNAEGFPWYIAGEKDVVCDVQGHPDGKGEANAALIVLAVNHHDALVEALQRVMAETNEHGLGCATRSVVTPFDAACNCSRREADALLRAIAEGQEKGR